VSTKFDIYIFRFEWSVGYAGNDSPLGIYNQVEENVWQDAGKMMESVYTTKPGKKSLHFYFILTYSNGIYCKIFYSILSNRYDVINNLLRL
jgi:hypothetical protein